MPTYWMKSRRSTYFWFEHTKSTDQLEVPFASTNCLYKIAGIQLPLRQSGLHLDDQSHLLRETAGMQSASLLSGETLTFHPHLQPSVKCVKVLPSVTIFTISTYSTFLL